MGNGGAWDGRGQIGETWEIEVESMENGKMGERGSCQLGEGDIVVNGEMGNRGSWGGERFEERGRGRGGKRVWRTWVMGNGDIWGTGYILGGEGRDYREC